MNKKICTFLLSLILVLSLSACSPAETVSGWIDSLMSLFPNDIEATLGKTAKEENHVMILSTGYVNMLKDGSYHIVYHLDDGRAVSLASNGIRCASSYDEYIKTSDEPEIDAEGNVVEIPREHIVLSDGIYYWVDDSAMVLYKVNPANYLACPVSIDASGIAFSSYGDTTWNGKQVRYETYTTDSGPITFYYENKQITGIAVDQEQKAELCDVTSIDKYYSSSFIALPSTYSIVDAWQ